MSSPRPHRPAGTSRRGFLASLALGGIAARAPARAAVAAPPRPAAEPEADAIAAAYRDNVYTRLLGVRPHLPAHEHITRLGGCRMPKEVVEAMVEANEYFVDMDELTLAAGRRVAELLGAEAALVTAGAFSAMVLGAAACLTGTDPAKIDALPHPTWARRECLVHTAHRFGYDRAYRAAGMTIVEARTREELRAGLGPKTAMIAALAAVEKQREFGPPIPKTIAHEHGPEVPRAEELIALGREAGVPVLVDMASDLPPFSNLRRFVEAGADLVVVSGGKGIRGPQSTGILAGRADLVEAARLQLSPNNGIGRGMKIGKEEIVGLVVALERYVRLDHDALVREWNAKARWIAEGLADLPGVVAEAAENTMGYEDVYLTWDRERVPLSVEEVKRRLREGDPPLVYDGDTVRTRLLRDGEEVLVLRRLREVLGGAARG